MGGILQPTGLLRAYEKKEKKWIPYEEKIGNCELVPLYGKHAIYMDRTEECAKIIKDHIDSLK